MIKKFLASLLSLIMVLAMMPTNFVAASTQLTDTMVTLDKMTTVWSNKDVKPTVTVKNGSTVLNQGTDYDVEFKKGSDVVTEIKNAGTYSVVITGKGTYTGTVTKYFTVEKLDLARCNFEIKDTIKSELPGFDAIPNSGTVNLPAGKVVLKQNLTEIDPSFYELTTTKRDANSINILVKCKAGDGENAANAVKGSQKEEFFYLKTSLADYKIVGTNGKLPLAEQIYTGSKIEPQIAVVPKDNADGVMTGVLSASNYTVQYTDNINAGTNVGKIKVVGKGNFTGNLTETFTIKQRDLSQVSITVGNAGKGGVPSYSLVYGNKTLKYGTDFTYSSNSDTVGTGQGEIDFIGQGNFTGRRTLRFNVVEGNIVSVDADFPINTMETYTGSTLTPKLPALRDGTKVLSLNIDYSILYRNPDKNISTSSPVESGEYEVVAIGQGKYGGEKILGKYRINPIPFNENYITINVTSNGTSSSPRVEITATRYGKTVRFVEGKDFKIASYSTDSKTNSGTVYLQSTGAGNLASGSIVKSYTLVQKDIANCRVSFGNKFDVQPWTGSYINIPDVEVFDGSSRLTQSVHFKVEVKDPTGKSVTWAKDAGQYRVIITGINAYRGTKELVFRVKGLPQNIKLEKTSFKTNPGREPINIKANNTGDVKGFTYESSDKTVAQVNSDGVVTPLKPGRAVITLKTKTSTKYEPATASVEIKVYPNRVVNTKPSVVRNRLKVRWYKETGVTKYEIKYSTSRRFDSDETFTKLVRASKSNAETQFTYTKKLQKYKKYYVKVRAVKTVVDGSGRTVNYYGKYSKWGNKIVK